MGEPEHLYALLVGINKYAVVKPPLSGCRDDIAAVGEYLLEDLGVPPENVRVVEDEEATHAAILSAFEEHLIDNAATSVAAGAKPAALFHFSGHGAQALAVEVPGADPEPDGFDETLVPYDSRLEKVYDIKDWQIGGLIDRLAEHTEEITVVLDCCHSGSGTRGEVRGCEPDLRPQPPVPEDFVPREKPKTNKRSAISSWSMGDNHALLAACSAGERANEFRPGGEGTPERGVFTYFLLEELRKATRPPTFAELHDRLRSRVRTSFPTQTPQCEGDTGRQFLGGLRPQRAPAFPANVVDGSLVIGAGIAHGLFPGGGLLGYAADDRKCEGEGIPLVVRELAAAESKCSAPPGADVGRVQLDGAPGGFRWRLKADGGRPGLDVDWVGDGEDLQLGELAGGGWELRDKDGTALLEPYGADEVGALAGDLGHLARFYAAMHLSPGDDVKAEVSLEIERAESGERAAEATLRDGERLRFVLRNQSRRSRYASVLVFGYDWDISVRFPKRGRQQALYAGGEVTIGGKRGAKVGMPEGMEKLAEVSKVIATVDEADFTALEQPPLSRKPLRPERTPYLVTRPPGELEAPGWTVAMAKLVVER